MYRRPLEHRIVGRLSGLLRSTFIGERSHPQHDLDCCSAYPLDHLAPSCGCEILYCAMRSMSSSYHRLALSHHEAER